MGAWPQAPDLFSSQVGVAPSSKSALGAFTLGGTASAVWPSANKAILYPFRIDQPLIVRQLYWENGSVQSGHVDCGIYTPDGTLLASTGSTVPSGANAIQAVALGTPLEIGPGWFYVALSVDNTTAAFQRHSPNSNVGMFQAIGMAEAASAFVLPATLAPAAVTAVYLPVCGFFTRSSP